MNEVVLTLPHALVSESV